MEVTGQPGYFKSRKYSKTKKMEGQRLQNTKIKKPFHSAKKIHLDEYFLLSHCGWPSSLEWCHPTLKLWDAGHWNSRSSPGLLSVDLAGSNGRSETSLMAQEVLEAELAAPEWCHQITTTQPHLRVQSTGGWGGQKNRMHLPPPVRTSNESSFEQKNRHFWRRCLISWKLALWRPDQ